MDLRELAEPEARAGHVVVRVSAVGLCGGDIRIYRGEHPYVRYPLVQGHEFCGTVLSFGPGYEGPLQRGDLVAIEPLLPCGGCFACRRGRANCCVRLEVVGVNVNGALAEEVAVPSSCCYAVGDLPAELAALVEPISIGLQAVVRSGAGEGDQVLVLGAGPIGQAITVCAVDRGAEVMVVDKHANRLELATRLGARWVGDVTLGAVDEAVLSWTRGDGPAIVVEATGVPALVRQAADLVAPSGTVVVVGISTDDVALSVLDFTRKELSVLGSRNNAGLFSEAVKTVQRDRERVGQLITHRFPLQEARQAIELVRDHPEEAGKVLVVIGE